MKILVIHGCLRKGKTYGLAGEAISILKRHENVEVEEIGVDELELPLCLSCHACFSRGEGYCPHYGVVGRVARAIEGCDGLIVSGVVYSMHLNAAMKNLIDHLSYYFHRPRLFDKKGLVITTTAGAGAKTVAKYLRSVLGHWGVSNIKTLGFAIPHEKLVLTEKQHSQLEKTVESFYSAVLYDRSAPPTFESVAVHNGFRAMGTSKNPVSQCDNAFWAGSEHVGKVYPRRIGVVKSAMGALSYKLFKSMFDK